MKYPVCEIFRSLQGEGYNVGRKVVFVRLSGCNLACPFCDTDHASGEPMDTFSIIRCVESLKCRAVILTGGEPTIHNLNELLYAFNACEFWIAIETNGTNDLKNIRGGVDYISVSPKRGASLHDSVYDLADELRVVNDRLCPEDFDCYAGCAARHRFISPMESSGQYNLRETIILLNAVNERNTRPWYLSQQIHKTLKIK